MPSLVEGKTAMAIAQLTGEERVASTVIVDIAPIDYNRHKVMSVLQC